jgi:hypothetical protein
VTLEEVFQKVLFASKVTFEEAFLKVRAFAANADPALAGVELMQCADVKDAASRKGRSRAFMHTGHVAHKICYASPAKFLSLNCIVGILLHEFGHLGSNGGEVDADQWVLVKLGIALEYKGKLCLEWVDDITAKKVLGL